jgi:uncharacterized secreted protein with C-terminal beta-propeller domain
MALTLIGAVWLAACGGSGNTTGTGSGTPPTASTLSPFASAQAMEAYLKNALVAGSSQIMGDRRDAIGVPAASTASFTTTNLQEAGVDEADRFKSDGRHFYILGRDPGAAADSLRIRRLTGVVAGQARSGSIQIASLTLPTEAYYARAYLANNRANGQPDVLLAIGESGGYSFPSGAAPLAIARDWFAPWDWRAGKTEAQWLDVADAASPKLGRRVSVDGYYVASRRIGDTVYLVTRYTPNLPGIVAYPANQAQITSNQQTIAAATLNDLLPKWSLDGAVQGPLVGAASCYRDADTAVAPSADLIVVSAIDLGNPQAAPRAQCLTGGSETVYVSTDALYVATTDQAYSVQTLVGAATTLRASYPESITTRLHKFALAAQGPSYRGSGSVVGHLGWEQDKKAFRMGEHQGTLRVVTSLGQTWDGSASSHLSLLREADGKLITVSELPNSRRPAAIGKPGESLYAARFIGARGYLVTFRVTDPLYVLDLADPADPRLAGELAVPGYSDYLHPLGERWLIGVGKDAIPDTTGTSGDVRGAWYQGIKVALFDVADPSRPKEVNSLVIGKRGSQSAVLSDHHAFTLLATGRETGELARLALPIERHEELPAAGNAADPRTWYDWSDTGLHLISVADTGLRAQGAILAETRGTADQPTTTGQDDRAFLNGQEAHFLHGLEMWASPW